MSEVHTALTYMTQHMEIRLRSNSVVLNSSVLVGQLFGYQFPVQEMEISRESMLRRGLYRPLYFHEDSCNL